MFFKVSDRKWWKTFFNGGKGSSSQKWCLRVSEGRQTAASWETKTLIIYQVSRILSRLTHIKNSIWSASRLQSDPHLTRKKKHLIGTLFHQSDYEVKIFCSLLGAWTIYRYNKLYECKKVEALYSKNTYTETKIM